jgi:hypothetical protein
MPHLTANKGEDAMRYAILVTLIVTGCATEDPSELEPPWAPAVQTLKDGRDSVTVETTSQASNAMAEARHRAVKIADHFCAKQERFASVQTFDDSTTSKTYVATLTFACR